MIQFLFRLIMLKQQEFQPIYQTRLSCRLPQIADKLLQPFGKIGERVCKQPIILQQDSFRIQMTGKIFQSIYFNLLATKIFNYILWTKEIVRIIFTLTISICMESQFLPD